MGKFLTKFKNKYHAQATMVEGIRFASKKEAKRWQELNLLVKAKIISELERQVTYKIIVNGELICKYILDFKYLNMDNGEFVHEDSKGFRTKEYNLKKKLMKAIYGISILET